MESARIMTTGDYGRSTLEQLISMQQSPLEAVAHELRKLPWADMVRFAQYLCEESERLRSSDMLDRDGFAQVLADWAGEIVAAADRQRAAVVKGEGE